MREWVDGVEITFVILDALIVVVKELVVVIMIILFQIMNKHGIDGIIGINIV